MQSESLHPPWPGGCHGCPAYPCSLGWAVVAAGRWAPRFLPSAFLGSYPACQSLCEHPSPLVTLLLHPVSWLGLLWYSQFWGCPLPRALLDAGTLRFSMELHCFLWKHHSLMRPLEGLVEVESSAGHQRKAWKGKSESRKDRKVSLKEKITFLFTGADSGLRGAEEGSKSAWRLTAQLLVHCVLQSPNIPGYSSAFWTGEHQLGRSHGAEGRDGPDPRAQGTQQEWAAFAIMPRPSSLHELLPFPPSFWCNNLFLIDIFILNTGKMPEW